MVGGATDVFDVGVGGGAGEEGRGGLVGLGTVAAGAAVVEEHCDFLFTAVCLPPLPRDSPGELTVGSAYSFGWSGSS